MTWIQKTIKLSPKPRGCHLVTDEILTQLSEIAQFQMGLCHIFVKHTSASLTLNENSDPDVRQDLEMALNTIAPDNLPYTHVDEGPDDMPAHVKCSLMGAEMTVPVSKGRLALGTWQGIYLNEHRDSPSSRTLIITINGAS